MKTISLPHGISQDIASLVLPQPSSSAGISLSQNDARDLITRANGIFIGKAELAQLYGIAPDALIPDIPAEFSRAFLESTHPLRGGSIASHIIVAFDHESYQWHTIDRGEGGKSDIVPGSLGGGGSGLIGSEQDKLLEKDGIAIKVEGINISSHKDSFPIERILDNAVFLHLAAGKPIETAPLYGIWGRTGDEQRGETGCRVVLGYPDEDGIDVQGLYRSELAYTGVGLLAGWNLTSDDQHLYPWSKTRRMYASHHGSRNFVYLKEISC